MAAADHAVVLSSALGFAGSVLLFLPGWRASQFLREVDRVRRAVPDDPTDGDPGRRLLEILHGWHGRWSPVDHGCLLLGILLVASSFAVDLVSAIVA